MKKVPGGGGEAADDAVSYQSFTGGPVRLPVFPADLCAAALGKDAT